MEQFDFAILGAGAAGEAAAHLALSRGQRVAIIEQELFGGSCPFWACMPSKALLHAASVHHHGGELSWPDASAFRDWMIVREEGDRPDDERHMASIVDAGGVAIRGRATIDGPGRVRVTPTDGGAERALEAHHLIIAVGSSPRTPPIDGLRQAQPWTNREATTSRTLPRSLIVLGGGPTGIELAQVYARYGVPTTVLESGERILKRDHPRSSQALTEALEHEGVVIRSGVRAERVIAASDGDGAHRVALSDGSWVEGHTILIAVGRERSLDRLNLASLGIALDDGSPKVDGHLRIADRTYLVGDPAGPELFTHVAHYQGEAAVRIALGDTFTPDLRAIPRATYTEPETASVGLLLEEAREAGHDAFEVTADLGETAKGYVTRSSGHVTLVVDRRAGRLLGAFIAGVGASETIHEAVLAIKARIPIRELADTIHAFPTTARVMGGLFGSALAEIENASSADS